MVNLVQRIIMTKAKSKNQYSMGVGEEFLENNQQNTAIELTSPTNKVSEYNNLNNSMYNLKIGKEFLELNNNSVSNMGEPTEDQQDLV